MSAAGWITKRRELLDAATGGPWDYYGPHFMSDEMSVTGGATSTDVLARGLEEPDAALIADARTSLPRALDALDAVLSMTARGAIGARARGDSDEERRWLDLQIVVETALDARP